MHIETNNILNKKIIIVFLILLIILFFYIIHLNLNILNLEDNIESKDKIYKIQINNRINEIEQLNSQLSDLQGLLNIGLDISSFDNIYLDTKLNESDKKNILASVPSASPLEKVFITSKFGYRLHPIFNTNKMHTGVDLRASVGTKIYSTADGIVLTSKKEDLSGYGKMVEIVHNYGFQTLFGHMSEVYVEEGDIVKKGTLIGLSGNTGSSNGPHLHYEIKYLKKYLDSQDFLYWNTKTFDTIFKKNQDLINWKNMIFYIKNNRNNTIDKDINVVRAR